MLEVRLEGLKEMRRQLQDFRHGLQDVVAVEVARTAFEVESTAKLRAPRNLGHLRSDIRVQYEDRGLVAAIGHPAQGGIKYAAPAHDGRRPGKMPPLEPIRFWAARKLGRPEAAFPIARKIGREGTRGVPYLAMAFDEHAEKLPRRVEHAIERLL